MKRLLQLLDAYCFIWKLILKLWCIKHIIRPLLKVASERGMIAGRVRR